MFYMINLKKENKKNYLAECVIVKKHHSISTFKFFFVHTVQLCLYGIPRKDLSSRSYLKPFRFFILEPINLMLPESVSALIAFRFCNSEFHFWNIYFEMILKSTINLRLFLCEYGSDWFEFIWTLLNFNDLISDSVCLIKCLVNIFFVLHPLPLLKLKLLIVCSIPSSSSLLLYLWLLSWIIMKIKVQVGVLYLWLLSIHDVYWELMYWEQFSNEFLTMCYNAKIWKTILDFKSNWKWIQ